jgi:hypothetical protein
MYKIGTQSKIAGNERKTGMYALLLDTAISTGRIAIPPASREKCITFRSALNRFRSNARRKPNYNIAWDMVTNSLECLDESHNIYQIVMTYEREFWSAIEDQLGINRETIQEREDTNPSPEEILFEPPLTNSDSDSPSDSPTMDELIRQHFEK